MTHLEILSKLNTQGFVWIRSGSYVSSYLLLLEESARNSGIEYHTIVMEGKAHGTFFYMPDVKEGGDTVR